MGVGGSRTPQRPAGRLASCWAGGRLLRVPLAPSTPPLHSHPRRLALPEVFKGLKPLGLARLEQLGRAEAAELNQPLQQPHAALDVARSNLGVRHSAQHQHQRTLKRLESRSLHARTAAAAAAAAATAAATSTTKLRRKRMYGTFAELAVRTRCV